MFFDTHCHLNDERFAEDIEGYINRALEAGVTRLVVISWDVESSKKAIQLAEKYPFIYAAVGIHPVDAVKTPKAHLMEIEKLLKHPKVVALGEIGLDYYWIKDENDQKIEHDFFIAQIEMANRIGKPIIIHMREATNDTYQIIKNNQPLYGGIMHSYGGSKEMVKNFVELGMYIGLGGPVTYLNAKEPKEVAKIVPENRLLLETDAPYLTPHPFRGKTNESYRIPLIASEIAKLRETTIEEIAKMTTDNARTLFKL